jgi:LemA protein
MEAPMWIVLGVLAFLVLGGILIYNSLVRLRVQSENAWADIDVQLKRRYDLIPNVVETVKGYAAHERQTLDQVVAARSRAMAAQGPAAKGEAEGMLGQALRSLFALAEAYPQLRAVESFTQLQATLGQMEEAIQSARRYYNAVVRDLNTRIAQFPSNLVASAFRFQPREFFELPNAAEREAPRVSFDGGEGKR